MATKDRRKLQHIHSSIADKQPTPQSLEVGEIAVNNSAGKEFISLKNSNDKVVRFSSDSTIIDWIENKEVVPYKGYVRGETGPSATSGETPSADEHGSYGITNDDLLANKSNLIFKINQVAAKKTVKYDKINAAKDLYNKDINPSENTPTGKTDGAGFFIDMSRYAMIGANPSFSSITVTDKSDLSGNTTIANGDGTGTRTGHTLAIKTTDVTANDTNWTETITTKKSTVTTEEDKIGTLNESAATRTTVVGAENLTVSGTTTEVHTGNVTITNANNVIENTSGTTTIDRKGNVSENNQNNVIVVTSGTTSETKKGKVTETNLADKQESTSGNSYNDVKLAYSGTTGGTTTEVKVGNVIENHSGTTIENKRGDVTENNLANKTENTTGVLTENNSSSHIVNTTGATNITRTGVVTEDNKNNVTRTTSGTTTETFKNQVTENNQSGYTVNTTGNVIVNTTGTTTETKNGNVTENHSGTTTENKVGNVTENNLANKQENTSGTHKVYTTGDTCINSQANANFYGKVSTNIGVACDGTKGSATTVYGTTTTISGNTTNVTGTTMLNLSGNTINERALTVNTNVTSAYTSATTATTVIGTANTTANTATLSGNTLDITEATRLSAKTPSTYVSGTSLNVVETNTDIESCGRISGKTNAFTIQECAAGSGKTVINQTDIKASGATLSFDETTSISAKTPTTTLSGTGLTITEATSTINSTNTNLTGTNLTISESNTSISSCTKLDIVSDDLNFGSCTTAGTIDFNFCNGFGVNSNNIKLHQCATAGTISISAQTQNINGGNLTVNESGNTAINTTGTTNIKSTGNTNVETNGANNKVTIQASGTGGDVEVFAKDTLCMSGGSTAAMVGTTKTNIGKNCSDGGQTTTLNLNGNTINESGTSVNISGTTTNISANTLNENVVGTTTINRSGTTTEYNRTGYTSNTTGDTCIQSTADVNVGGAANTNIGTNCDDTVKANYVNIKAKSGITETANTVTISGTSSVNVSGNTVNVSGVTTNISGASITEKSTSATCIEAGTNAAIVGAAKTNVGRNCSDGGQTTTLNLNGNTINETGTTVNISGSTSANVSGATVNVSGGSITEASSGKTCITAGSDLNLGGDTNTRLGYNCDGTGISNNTNIFASTAVTINAPTTNITGDTYLSGNTYFHKTCTGLTNYEIDAAFCEVLSRGAVTIEKNTSPTDPQLATVYTVKQNGAVINTIEVAKDQFLQNAEVVKNTSGEWVIRLTWWIYDPDSGTHTTATTDVNASELVKDLTYVNPDDNGTALNHNVKVYSWYDSTSGDMKFSAETTQDMHVGNMYVTGTTSAATVSGTNVNGGTISGTTVKGVAISGTNITASDAIRANNVSANTISAATGIRANNVSASTISATTFTGAMSKKLTWAAGAFTADTTGYNGSADKTITVPTAISHLATRGKLTITHNGLSADTYDPATDKSMTLPHSALSFSYGSVSAKTGSDSYNTSAAKSITIPTSIDDLKNYNGSCVEIGHNVCVTGTITATQAIYSSDRNLKNNIKDVEYRMVEDAHNVRIKQFNFKSEPENLVVGVIAQEVEEHNLGDFVYTKEDGNKAVDYTSLMMLKIKYLENENEYLKAQMAEIRLRMENLENKINNQ